MNKDNISRREFLKLPIKAAKEVATGLGTLSLLYTGGVLSELVARNIVGEAFSPDKDLGNFVELPPLEVGDNTVNFVGVRHSLETLHSQRENITTHVKSTDFIGLEYFFEYYVALANPGLTEEQIAQKISEFPGVNLMTEGAKETILFFIYLARIAATENKPIVVMNPENAWSDLLQTMQEGIVPAIFLKKGIDVVTQNNLSPQKLTRRKALLMGTAAAWGGWNLLSEFDLTSLARSIFTGKTRAGGSADALGNSQLDYRDTTTAYLGKKFLEKQHSKTLTFIQGFAHNGVREYMSSDSLLKTKEAEYALSYKQLGEKSTITYSFDSKSNLWIKS